MLTKYFWRGVNISKYNNVFYVGWLSLSGLDEISEAVFEAGTSLTGKAEQVRKRLQNVYAPMLRVFYCVLLTGKIKLFLEVKMKRESECCLWKLKWRERERVLSLEDKM